jgi:hypothetical protein
MTAAVSRRRPYKRTNMQKWRPSRGGSLISEHESCSADSQPTETVSAEQHRAPNRSASLARPPIAANKSNRGSLQQQQQPTRFDSTRLEVEEISRMTRDG